MNLLIYAISIIIIICILYHFNENIKNLYGVIEGFSERVSGYRESGYKGKQNKTTSGRICQNWRCYETGSCKHRGGSLSSHIQKNKNNASWNQKFGIGNHNYCRNPDNEPKGIWCYTTDPKKRWEYCDPKPRTDLTGLDLCKSGRCANYKVSGRWVRDGVYSKGGSLEDCAGRFGEEGGVFSYNPSSKGCLYTKTNEPHNKYNIKGISSGCKPEYWGGWKFYQAVKKPPSGSRTINKFFADKTLNRKCYSGSTHAKVPLSEEKTIPEYSTAPYKLQYEFRIKDQGWGNPTYGYLILKNNTTGKEHRLKSSSSRGGVTVCGEADISQYVKAGNKVQLRFKESRCWSGHTLYWYYYKNMNLTYKYKFVVRPSLRPKFPRTRVAKQLTYGNDCMPKSTLVLVGERPMKPRKGYVLENAQKFKGKWNNYAISFTIKPLSKKSGWRNIIHNTMNGGNCCNNYERWPGIWFHSNTTKLHICWQRNQKFNPSYQLPLNKKSTLTCIVNGAKVRAVIRDENDNIKYDQSITLSQHSPPNNPWRNGSLLPLIDYGGSMQKMPNRPRQTKLGECEGDCDRDSDCQTGMLCYQRSKSSQQVPGCKIGGKMDIPTHDYCYYANRQTFYMSDIWYEPADVEITELILDSNYKYPTYKIFKPMPVPKTANAFYYTCEKKTFMEHWESAIAMGGHLASIHSAEENEAIRKIIPYSGRVFIGAIRKRPGSGNSAEKWAWTDGSKWDYANWRSGEPNDCCKAQTNNIGEIYGEIQKRDGKWNDIFPIYNNIAQKHGAVYKLNATYPVTKNIKRLFTDGGNSWEKSKNICEGPQNMGNLQGSFGTLASRREILNFLKGKVLSGNKWTPTSEGENVWLQVGKKTSRTKLSPDYSLLHQDIPDFSNLDGDAAKPVWGTSNDRLKKRGIIFCKIPPDGQTWDKTAKTFVPHTETVGTGGATSVTGSSTSVTSGSTSVTGGTSSVTGGSTSQSRTPWWPRRTGAAGRRGTGGSTSLTGRSTSVTGGSTSVTGGATHIPLTSSQAKNYKVGQKITIRNEKGEKEVRTIIGVVN